MTIYRNRSCTSSPRPLCLAQRNARIHESEARNCNSDIQTTHLVRTKRVKEARDEAKKEIADYKANKEDEFKKFEAEVRDSQPIKNMTRSWPNPVPITAQQGQRGCRAGGQQGRREAD